MTIIEDYLKLTKQYINEYGPKTILLMQVGSFFEVYAITENDGSYSGSNITDFSQINDMIIAKKNMFYQDKQVVMAGFGLTQLEKYSKKLQEKDYTIVVYTQDIQSKNTTRSLSEIISPGTFFNNDQEQISNNVTSIWIEQAKNILIMGISNVDIYTGVSSISQFTTEYFHNPCTYDDLERYVSLYKPRETIFVSNLENSISNDIIQFIGLDNCKVHNIYIGDKSKDKPSGILKHALNAEKQKYQLEIFNQYFPNNIELFNTSYSEHCIAIQSLTILLDFIYQHSPHLVNKLSIPRFENHTDKLILANHSLKQLNIIDDDRHTGKLRSLASLLNNCETIMGKRKFIHILNNPLTNPDTLNNIYNNTEYLLQDNKWESYRNHLSNIGDIEKFSRKLVLKRVTPKDLSKFNMDIHNAIKISSLIYDDNTFLNHLHRMLPLIKDINVTELSQQITDHLNSVFNLEICSNIDDMSPEKLILLEQKTTGFIRPGQCETIDNLRSQAFDGREQLEAIRKFLSDTIKSNEKTSKIDTQYVKIHEAAKTDPNLQTTQRRATLFKTSIEKQLKNKLVENIEYIDTEGNKKTFALPLNEFEYRNCGNSKTTIIITSHTILSLCSGLQTAKDKLVIQFIQFYSNFITNFFKYTDIIHQIANFVSFIDIEQCRCFMAYKFNYCKPTIKTEDKAFFDFKELRHPLIEHLQTNELYVTNDLKLGAAQAQTQAHADNGLLLYGTNAVGKTSFIKSVGIAIIMAQCGLYVPAMEFTFSPYKHIFTRILGQDNIFKGLSTFAVEMSELRTILKYSDKDSLILGDEVCSGTESDSALSIFTTALEKLHNNNSTFLFATHFHEINNYDEIKTLDKLKLMHMEVIFDYEKNKLIYDRKLKSGPGESMYGLEVCKSLNLEEEFLQRAHDIRMKYNPINKNILSLSTSHYSSKKVLGTTCELCKNNISSDVHHLNYQQYANNDNQYIKSFHKNHIANLINICKECHDNIHKNNTILKKTKTSHGYELTK